MNLFIFKYLFLLILEGEMTSMEMSEKLGCSLYNASHAAGILLKLGLVKHPEKRIRSWVAESTNALVLDIEELILVSKNDEEVRNLLSIPSVISIGTWFHKNKKETTINDLTESTGLSRVSVIKVLKRMTSLKLISRKIGKPNRYYPSSTLLAQLFFKISNHIMNLFTDKKAEKESPQGIINKIKNHESVLILIHYGSSARGKTDRLSDIDLFVVTRDNITRGEILSEYSRDNIDLTVYSKAGFLDFLEKHPDFAAHLATAKILKGKDIFEAVIL